MNGILVYRQVPVINKYAALPDRDRVPAVNCFGWNPPVVRYSSLSRGLKDHMFLETVTGTETGDDSAPHLMETLKTTP